MVRWTDGAPPELLGAGKALVVVELPSRFIGTNLVYYRCIEWTGEDWSDKEVYRARRWMRIPLPQE